MIRHLPYFEALSTLDETSLSWYPTLAGLTVLDLVDRSREDPTLVRSDLAAVAAVSETISRIGDGNPVKRILTRVATSVSAEDVSWNGVGVGLFDYGKVLDLDGSWKLAVDVFETVADIARAEHQTKAAIEATTALGGAARRSGDWDKSAAGYADAAHLASAVGDRALGLTVRVGTANTLVARGNLPAAKEVFEEVIQEAEPSGFEPVTALALHGRSTVAYLEKDFSSALILAHRALEKTSNPSLRDNITADIAATFVELGMREAGRDAHLVLSLTSRYQWVRTQATINLMELAALDGMEEAFDQYAALAMSAPADPRLRAYSLLYYGQGCERFGRLEEAELRLQEARDFATRHRVHQVSHEASEALAALGKKSWERAATKNPWSVDVSADVRSVANAFVRLRESAQSSTRVAESGVGGGYC